MIFRDLIPILREKGYNIKVGSHTSFIYCGKIGKNFEEVITGVSDKLFDNLLKRHRKARLEKAQQIRLADTEYLGKKRKRQMALKRAETLKTRIANLKKQIDSFTPLLERKVLDVYDGVSFDEPRTKIVKLTGNEIGKFWTIKEYNDFINKKERKNKANGKKITELRLCEIKCVQSKYIK